MDNICPLCNIRISDWSDVTGGTKVVKHVPLVICHTRCLIDYKLRHGKEYGVDEVKREDLCGYNPWRDK